MSTRIDVSTAAMHLAIAPKNPLGSTVYTSIMLEQRISENILKSIVTGISLKMTRAYNYAQNFYELKLPSGTSTQINLLTDEEISSLVSLNINYPLGVICLDSGYEQYSPKLRIIKFLQIDRGYSSVNNSVTSYPGYTNTNLYKVLLSSVTINADGLHIDVSYDVYIKTEFIDIESGTSTWDWIREQTAILDGEGNVISSTNSIHVESVLIENSFILASDTPCFYAVYQKLDINLNILPQYYTWFYDLTSGLYPELEEPTIKFKGDNFLPVIPLRYNNVDLTDISLSETPLYVTSKKLLKIIDIPFEYLGKQINDNPSVAEIDHAYIMFGVDLQTNQSESLLYLNSFFNHVHNLNAYSNYKISKSNGISFLEHGLNLTISYDNITSSILEGMLDVSKIGTTTKTITLGLTDTLTLDTKISKTLIRRVIVTNLVVNNNIYEGHSIITTLRDVASNSKNHNLIIPIQYNLANDLPLLMRNTLYIDGIVMVINSVVITHLKWYQEKWFSFVVIIVMVIILIVITIFSWGSLTTWWAELCALILAGSFAAAALMVLIPILISLAIGYAAKWIVTTYGAKIGIIGAIILTAVAFVLGGVGAASEVMKEFVMSYAQLALQMGMALVSSANEFLVIEATKIKNEYDSFSNLLGIKNEELKAKQDLLEMAYDVDPLIYTKPARLKIIPNESPDAFIQRTLGLVENTMYILHEEIANFYSDRLKLPRKITANMYGSNLV